MAASLAALLASIASEVAARDAPAGMTTKVVAVDGAGGAGKSTFAEHLPSFLGDTAIVHTDDFASWENPIDWWPRLLELVLEPLARNEERLRFEALAWEAGHAPAWVELRATPVLILEGVTASRDAFRPYRRTRSGSTLPPTSASRGASGVTGPGREHSGRRGWPRRRSIGAASAPTSARTSSCAVTDRDRPLGAVAASPARRRLRGAAPRRARVPRPGPGRAPRAGRSPAGRRAARRRLRRRARRPRCARARCARDLQRHLPGVPRRLPRARRRPGRVPARERHRSRSRRGGRCHHALGAHL